MDHVDRVLEQWAEQRPDLDVSPMAVIGRLSRLFGLVNAELVATFKSHGLDTAAFDVLATLRRNGRPLTPGELKASSLVSSGAITQRLDRLEAQGLVTRRPSESDGRSLRVSLTAAGLALIDEALPDHLATEERILAAFDPQQRADLAAALKTFLESMGDTVDLSGPIRAASVGASNLHPIIRR